MATLTSMKDNIALITLSLCVFLKRVALCLPVPMCYTNVKHSVVLVRQTLQSHLRATG